MKNTKKTNKTSGPDWRYTEPRDKVITVMMTASQQEAIKRAALADEKTASSWMLKVVLAALPKKEW